MFLPKTNSKSPQILHHIRLFIKKKNNNNLTNQQTSLSSPIFFSRIYFNVGRGCCNTHWIDIALDFQDFSDLNICELSILFKFQLLIFREADDEIKKLSRLAEQLNPKLNDLETSQFGQNSSTDQVDLDQLFNFLSKEVADSSAPSSGSIRSVLPILLISKSPAQCWKLPKQVASNVLRMSSSFEKSP